jgi:WD40 repeat protein
LPSKVTLVGPVTAQNRFDLRHKTVRVTSTLVEMVRKNLLRWVLLFAAGCHGGGHGSALPVPPPPDGEATTASPDGGSAPPLEAGVADGPGAVAAPDASTDAAGLTAATIWKACGNLAAELTALAQSGDGKWLAAGYGDGRVTLLEQATMTVAGRLDVGSGSGVGHLAFTDDGATLLTAATGSVKLWSVPKGTFQRELGTGIGGASLQVTGGPMPLVLAAGSSVPSVKLWRLDGPLLATMGDGALAAFSDGGQAVVVVSDAAPSAMTTFGLDGKMIRRFPVPVVQLPALSADGALMATVVDDNGLERVDLYSTSTGKRLWRSVDGVKLTRQLAFLDHPLRVVALADVGTDSLILDAATGKTLSPLPYRQAAMINPAADGSSLVAVTGGGRLARVSVSDGAARPGPGSEFAIMQRILGLAVTRDGRYLAAAGASTTWIIDLRENTLAKALEVPGFKPDFSPDGAALAMGGRQRAVYRVTDDGPAVTIDPGDAGPCLPSLVFSPDGQTLASGTCGKIELYRPDGTRLGEHPSAAVTAGVAWSPDGKRLATTGPELWPADGASPVWPALVPPAPDNGQIEASDNVVAYSPDGGLLLVSRSKGYFALAEWDTLTDVVRASDGLVMRSLMRRLGRRPSFSADGSWVVAGGYTFHLGSDTNRAFSSDRSTSVFLPDNRLASYGTEHILRVYCPTAL